LRRVLAVPEPKTRGSVQGPKRSAQARNVIGDCAGYGRVDAVRAGGWVVRWLVGEGGGWVVVLEVGVGLVGGYGW
jgi:hypothetical protein